MTTTTIDVSTNRAIPGTALPADETGWTRSDVWINTDAGALCGDYTYGPAFTAFYQRVLPDGRILAMEIDYYGENLHGNPNDLGIQERTFFHCAPNAEAFEAQEFTVEDYEYELADPFTYGMDDQEHLIAKLHELATADIRWTFTWGEPA